MACERVAADLVLRALAVDRVDVRAVSKEEVSKFVGESESLPVGHLRAVDQDNRRMARRVNGAYPRCAVEGCGADVYPGELSGGQQQRVAIARSLAMHPDVMLFDEITAALDPETVKEVLNTIRELAQEGMTCILVTHEMRFARELADTVYFTDGGVIVESGPPAELFDRPRMERTCAFLSQIL